MSQCATCGQENPSVARFCSACGQPMATPVSHREQRKTVTAVFCDLKGSTELGEALDSESVRRVVERYFAAMKAAILLHGGIVEKFIGDAVMAVFGIPTLHEDDALRAVRAAVTCVQALATLNEELEPRWGVVLQVRIGVNTGEVVAGDASQGQAFVTGDAVNVAARLEQAAGDGEILIGQETERLVRDAVATVAVAPLTLKGKAHPVPAFRLIGLSPERSSRDGPRPDSPMIGRATEMGVLEDAFEHVVRDGSCRLLTVLGEAGVGKSRLIVEFVDRVRSRAQVLRGRCLPYGEGITFWPVAEIVRDASGITERDSRADVRAKIGALVTDAPDGDVVAQRVAGLLGLDETTSVIEETFLAIRRFLEALAGRRSLVVVFDDLQWAEQTLIDLLEHVTQLTRDHPILIVCVARPELRETQSAFVDDQRDRIVLALKPLGERQSDELITSLLGAAESASALRLPIVAAARGNPLFVQELVRMLVDDGLLRRENGEWHVHGDVSQIAVPPTIGALLAARLDRLSDDERDVLQRGAVIGEEFWPAAVVELSRTVIESDVRAQLDVLITKELVRRGGTHFAGEEGLCFGHVLIRDVAYEGLLKRTRSELHEQFAGWLQARAGERGAEYDEIIGYHLEHAFRLRCELGPLNADARRVSHAAAAVLARAGERALQRNDLSAAANLLERAVELLEPDDPSRARLLLDLASALDELGQLEAADGWLSEVVATAQAHKSEALVCRATVQRAKLTAHQRGVSFTELMSETEHAVDALEVVADHAGLATACLFVGTLRFWLGEMAGAERAFERALVHARLASDHRAIDDVLSWLAAALLYGPTRASDGIRRCKKMLDVHDGSSKQRALVTGQIAVLEAMQGNLADARRLLESARTLLGELGLTMWVAVITIEASDVEMLDDDPATAERELRQALGMFEAIGDVNYSATAAGCLAEALYAQARFDEASEFSSMCQAMAASDDVDPQVRWRAVRAKLLARSGDVDAAKHLSLEAVALIEQTDFLNIHAAVLMDRAEVLALSARRTDAVEAAREAARLYDAKGNQVGAIKARIRISALADEERKAMP